MIIAVDGMGGDHAPKEIIKGCIRAARRYPDTEILITGSKEKMLECLQKQLDNLRIVNTGKSKRASVAEAALLVESGEADAMLAFGETGKAVSFAAKHCGLQEGIDLPAIATLLPGRTLILDFGAVSDCEVENLVQFARLGLEYASDVLEVKNPTLALLSIGEEPTKGNRLTKVAHQRFKKIYPPEVFIGNLEGGDVLLGKASVIVIDGFTGNIVLKALEGFLTFVKMLIKTHLVLKIAVIPAIPLYLLLRRYIDSTNHAGQPLLGINGLCFIGHGNSKANAVFHGITSARTAVIQKKAQT